jgi:drug/metabolite transporter (DMT)-like permease
LGYETTVLSSTSRAKDSRLKVHLALLVVQLAFASQAVESKVAMMPRESGGEAIPAEALAMARMLGGALFFQAIARFIDRDPDHEPVARRDQWKLAGLSVLGIALNQALFLMGLKLTTPFAVSLLGATIPVVTAGLAVVARQDRLRLRTVIGLSLSITGVLTLTGIGTIDKGAVLVAMNSVAYSTYIVLSRAIVKRHGALVVVTWIFTWAALIFAPFGAPSLVATLPSLTLRGSLYLAYIVAVPTIIAYSFNAWALARSTATLVTVYIYLQPVITALIAWVQLGQGVTKRTLLAGILILIGVSVVALRAGGPSPEGDKPRER